MKILHIDTRPDWRGGQLQILLTLRGQRARGHDAQLMARRDSPLAQRASGEGFPVHYIPAHFLRVRAALCLREILDQQQFDIVHAHDPHALTAAWLARAHRRAGLVASRRVALPLSRGRWGLARYRAARKIIAVSQFVAKTVTDAGISPDSVAVIYDGVEIPPELSQERRNAARSRLKISDNHFLLGCVGYFVRGKRQDVALRAFAHIHKDSPNCKLLLVGDGPERAGLEKLAAELGIAMEVIFTGFVEDIESVYQALDLFVFPAVGEALGTSLALAMAQGLPAIAAASGGVPELVESGRNGILVPAPEASNLEQAIRQEEGGTEADVQARAANCSSAFADAIRKVLSDPALAARLGKAERQTIVERFSADALVDATLQKYSSIISHR
jgi:L-malate glycosyltransferase